MLCCYGLSRVLWKIVEKEKMIKIKLNMKKNLKKKIKKKKSKRWIENEKKGYINFIKWFVM